MVQSVTCPECGTVFPIDPAKVPAGGVRARCSVCPAIFLVDDSTLGPEEALATARAETPAPDTDGLILSDNMGVGAGESAVEQLNVETNVFGEREIMLDDPVAPPAVDEAPALADEPAPAVADEPEAMVADEPAAALADEPAAMVADEPAPALADEPEAVVADEPEAVVADEPEAMVADEPAVDEAPGPAVNPFQFGKRSPEDKARSLARSLVSDIIAYHADKHAAALAAGTLASEFEEEIEKSLKEYRDQVDPSVAENNRFFTEALNEILARGDTVFDLGV
ncbi:MAG: hypothetical protein D6701_05965 [Gemmatimonadetes bacterium]|nr:MAG: hypothetical protein D6701_05965 [Gemmatimonadota bacterium]